MESLLASLQGRIAAYTERSDASAILDEQALTDAGKLWQADQLTGGGTRIDVAWTIGWLHWCRHLALPDGQNQPDYLAARAVFDIVLQVDPMLVPEPLRRAAHPGSNPDDSVQAWQDAVNGAAADDPGRPALLSNLAHALGHRFELRGNPGDLDDAIAAGQAAADVAVTGHLHRVAILANLSITLLRRFSLAAAVADLTAAVAAARAAIDSAPAGHPDRALALSCLGNAVQTRFRALGDDADLDDAINLARAAVAATAHGDADRSRRLSNLAGALQARFERTWNISDLDAAVVAVRAAVDASPAGHSDRPMFLSNLAIALVLRFQHGHKGAGLNAGAELDVAADAAQGAVDATLVGHPDLAGRLSNLSAALYLRYQMAGNLADLDAAIAAGRRAVAAGNAEHPDRGGYLANLGNALHSRFQREAEPAYAQAALDAWRAAIGTASPAAVRIGSGRSWGDLAAALGRWPDAADGYAHVVGLLPVLAWQGVGRRSQERLLADWTGLAGDAAASAVAAGKPEQATEQLEFGRAVLWSQLLQAHDELDLLRAAWPVLAGRLDEVRTELDRASDIGTILTAGP
jgi:hypothetical protein